MIGLFEVEFNYFLEIECRDESMIQLRDAFVEELVYGCLGNKWSNSILIFFVKWCEFTRIIVLNY